MTFFMFLICLVKFENRHKGALRNLNGTDLSHSLLTLLLFFEELSLTRDVTTVTLCGNVLADSLYSLTSNDLRSDSRLDSDVELLPWDKFLELLAHLASEVVCMVSMDQ